MNAIKAVFAMIASGLLTMRLQPTLTAGKIGVRHDHFCTQMNTKFAM